MDPAPDPTDRQPEMLPLRHLRPEERALLAEWLAAAGDVSLAYVGSRSGDDPTIFQRIVIIAERGEEPSYLIDTPKGTNIWVVHPYCREQGVLLFGSLREALNSIRPVLPDPWKSASSDTPAEIGRHGRSMKI